MNAKQRRVARRATDVTVEISADGALLTIANRSDRPITREIVARTDGATRWLDAVVTTRLTPPPPDPGVSANTTPAAVPPRR